MNTMKRAKSVSQGFIVVAILAACVVGAERRTDSIWAGQSGQKDPLVLAYVANSASWSARARPRS